MIYNAKNQLIKNGMVYLKINNKIHAKETIEKSKFLLINKAILKKEQSDSLGIICETNYESAINLINIIEKEIKHKGIFFTRTDKKNITPNLTKQSVYRNAAFFAMNKGLYRLEKNYLIEGFKYDYKKYKELKKTVDLTSRENYKDSLYLFAKKMYLEKYQEKAKKIGLDFSFLNKIDLENYNFSLSYQEFFNLKEVREQFIKNYPFFINYKTQNKEIIEYRTFNDLTDKNFKDFRDHLSVEDYKRYNETLNNIESLKKEGEHYEFGNLVAKGFIAQPIVLIISAIMISLSIINIFVRILLLFIQNKKAVISIRLLSVILIFLPILINNNYKNSEYMTTIKENNYLLYSTTTWLQNNQKIMEIINTENRLINMAYLYTKLISLEYSKSKFDHKTEEYKNLHIKIKQIKKEIN